MRVFNKKDSVKMLMLKYRREMIIVERKCLRKPKVMRA